METLAGMFASSSRLIAPELLALIHYTFSNGIFPNHRKVALHKQGNIDDANSYRHISILPCLAKIFETLLHKRLINFFTKHSVIIP